MKNLPRISGKDCVKILKAAGFLLKRQQGRHMFLRWENPFAQVVVPDHKELDRGTLRGIIRLAGMSVVEFETIRRK